MALTTFPRDERGDTFFNFLTPCETLVNYMKRISLFIVHSAWFIVHFTFDYAELLDVNFTFRFAR